MLRYVQKALRRDVFIWGIQNECGIEITGIDQCLVVQFPCKNTAIAFDTHFRELNIIHEVDMENVVVLSTYRRRINIPRNISQKAINY